MFPFLLSPIDKEAMEWYKNLPDHYSTLDLNQRIMIKGLIASKGKSMPDIAKDSETVVLLELLQMIWSLSNFKVAVNMFVDKIIN